MPEKRPLSPTYEFTEEERLLLVLAASGDRGCLCKEIDPVDRPCLNCDAADLIRRKESAR